MKALVIDLCCGLGGWTRGFLAEGYQAVGFDIERHVYGEKRYPAQLVLQDIRTLHGSQFRNAAVIVASPPCQAYSYMAMPWDRAKREIRWQQWEKTSPFGDFRLNELFDACFRIAREAGVPIIVENVKGAQPWVGRAAWHYGSYYLWGDVPALMPFSGSLAKWIMDDMKNGQRRSIEGLYVDGAVKVPAISWRGSGEPGYKAQGFNVTAAQRYREGVKQPGHSGRAWFADPDVAGHFSSRSNSRKAASAMIAEIPFDLAQWIARCFKPSELERCDREIARIRQEPIAFTSPAYLSTMGVNDWQLERKVIEGERSELNVGGNLVRCAG